MENGKILELARFLNNRQIKSISIGFLNELQDALTENAVITPKRYSIIRKRVLDSMNDAVRANDELFDQFK